MKEHDATEIAFRNGFNSGADEIISLVDALLYKHYNGDLNDTDLYKAFGLIKNRYKDIYGPKRTRKM